MELREFVSEALKQLIDGVVTAQEYASSKGAFINPEGLQYATVSGNLHIAHDSVHTEIPQIIEFDVAVTISEGGEAKAGIGVFAGPIGIGTQATTTDGNIVANKIKFSVPILLPQQRK